MRRAEALLFLLNFSQKCMLKHFSTRDIIMNKTACLQAMKQTSGGKRRVKESWHLQKYTINISFNNVP